jgi:hypothetical protein
MELTFLGTSAGVPTRSRNVSGLALRTGSGWDLFDCGEATQHRLLRTSLSIPKLRRIFISHLHGDHCFGLFGLIGSRSIAGTTAPLTIFGPAGLSSMIDTVISTSRTHVPFAVDVVELGPDGGRVVDTDDLTIDAVPLAHRVTSYAWSWREADRPGRFDADAARAAGVPEGPMLVGSSAARRSTSTTVAGSRPSSSRVPAGPVVGSSSPATIAIRLRCSNGRTGPTSPSTRQPTRSRCSRSSETIADTAPPPASHSLRSGPACGTFCSPTSAPATPTAETV